MNAAAAAAAALASAGAKQSRGELRVKRGTRRRLMRVSVVDNLASGACLRCADPAGLVCVCLACSVLRVLKMRLQMSTSIDNQVG